MSSLENVDYEAWLAGSTESANVVVPLLLETLHPRSVVDVGCGLGQWLAVFKAHGVEGVLGYDGPWIDRSRLLVAPPEFLAADLHEPLRPERRFDLAVCLEVAHMLGPDRAAPIVAALVGLSDVVVFSAGIPGQGGTNRENEQWPAYWAELFAAHDFVASDPFRPVLWEQEDVKWWFRQNMVCYSTPEAAEQHPALARAKCSSAPLPLVHPECLEHVRSEMRDTTPARQLWPTLRP